MLERRDNTTLLTLWCEKTKVLYPPEHSDARHIWLVCVVHRAHLSGVLKGQNIMIGTVFRHLVKIYEGHGWISSHGGDTRHNSWSRPCGGISYTFHATLCVPSVSFHLIVKSCSAISRWNHRLFSTVPRSGVFTALDKILHVEWKSSQFISLHDKKLSGLPWSVQSL